MLKFYSDNKFLENFKLVFIFPMPLASTDLLYEVKPELTSINVQHAKIWLKLFDMCLDICKQRKDAMIVTGCDWDEHNVSLYKNRSLVRLLLNKLREKNINFERFAWLYTNPFVPDWIAEETHEDEGKIYTLFYTHYLDRCKTILREIYEPTFFERKTHWFLCLNRNARGHRLHLAYWFYKNKSRPAYYSCRIMGGQNSIQSCVLDKTGYDDINRKFYNNQLNEEALYHEFAKTLPWTLDNPDNSDIIAVKHQDHLPKKFIAPSACYIITETQYDSSLDYQGFITEKTLKGFVYGLPCVWVAPAYTIEAIKKLGFQSFDTLINEEYDNEIDCVKRMNLICQEIDRIQKIDDIADWYKKGISIYKHNLQIFKNLANRDVTKDIENYHNLWTSKFGKHSSL